MKSWKEPLLILIGSLLLAILLAEVGLRITGVQFPIFKKADPITGTSYIPNSRGWYTEEGRAYIQINSAGLRDREHSLEKAPNTIRVAVLGDSYSAAHEVPMENTFWSVVERDLNRHFARNVKKIEVINFGIFGHGPAQEYLTLHHKVWDYSPDIVLLAMFTGNDISDNHRGLRGKDNLPYYVYEGNNLVLDNSFLDSQGYRLRQNRIARILVRAAHFSRIVQLAIGARLGLDNHHRQIQLRQIGGHELVGEPGLDNRVYREPSHPFW